MRTLSVTVSDALYDNLKHAVSSRKISKFVSEAVEEKLNRKTEALRQAYVEASHDSQRVSELKIWDAINHEDWGPDISIDKPHKT